MQSEPIPPPTHTHKQNKNVIWLIQSIDDFYRAYINISSHIDIFFNIWFIET